MSNGSINQATHSDADSSATGKERSVCWNCHAAEFDLLFQAYDFDTSIDGYSIRRCRQCDLTYTGNVTEDALIASYSKTYYGSEKAKFLAVIETLIRLGHRQQAKKIIGLHDDAQSKLAAAARPLSVLDIGCGRALLLQEFDQLGANCVGIERNEYPGESPRGIEIYTGALSDAALSGKRFDIIVLWHVLEHITELGALLEELPKHLSPGGLLVLSVPNFLSWQSRVFKQYWFHLDLPRHVTHFEKNWLEKKLTTMGLEIISSSSFSFSQNIYGFIQSSLNKMMPKKPNRLYKLLTQSPGRRDWPALLIWVVLAIPLVPIAIVEVLLSSLSNQGATLTIYARNRDPAGNLNRNGES